MFVAIIMVPKADEPVDMAQADGPYGEECMVLRLYGGLYYLNDILTHSN